MDFGSREHYVLDGGLGSELEKKYPEILVCHILTCNKMINGIIYL